jgi:dimethylhistidine N-methyltransferase
MTPRSPATTGWAVAEIGEMGVDVRLGLTAPLQKELPSKYLYDDVGSALFDAICVLPEYGLSRAGDRLMRARAEDLVLALDAPTCVAELGSGAGRKTRWLLEALCRRRPTTYYPIEISSAALGQCARELQSIDSISVVGLEKPYLAGLLEAAAARPAGCTLLVLFLGSTIGNFDRPAGEAFLREVRRILFDGDALLLATDLQNDPAALLHAYDDAAGVTSAFNLNLLARLNRELDADFNLRAFAHRARWNAAERRIEMHLESTCAQEASIPGARLRVSFAKGETIWTESSHKFTASESITLGERAGFRCERQWVDAEWPFAHTLFRAA